MIRGRHRGLPVAIDRAVLLPSEYMKSTNSDEFAEVVEASNGKEKTPRRNELSGDTPTSKL